MIAGCRVGRSLLQPRHGRRSPHLRPPKRPAVDMPGLKPRQLCSLCQDNGSGASHLHSSHSAAACVCFSMADGPDGAICPSLTGPPTIEVDNCCLMIAIPCEGPPGVQHAPSGSLGDPSQLADMHSPGTLDQFQALYSNDGQQGLLESLVEPYQAGGYGMPQESFHAIVPNSMSGLAGAYLPPSTLFLFPTCLRLRLLTKLRCLTAKP